MENTKHFDYAFIMDTQVDIKKTITRYLSKNNLCSFYKHKSDISALTGGSQCEFRICNSPKYDGFMMIMMIVMMMMMMMIMMMKMMIDFGIMNHIPRFRFEF